ncbi:MAG TPA: hypothetical protein VFS07_09650 [Gemmatimonadales bacterium]|nr:hypothetical protein [Gemmatimonadales bacterium]
MRPFRLLAVLTLAAAAPPAAAQSLQPTQVVSVNPFGMMLEIFNGEYEHTAGQSFTVGVVGSTFRSEGDRYVNVDAFWRFYPQEFPDPFRGFSFGLKAGLTTAGDESSFGVGFDVDHSWRLGQADNFYVGVGVGLKRLFNEVNGDKFIPTLRLVNIGVAF